MNIQEYTVVSCSNCEEVWIVKDNPETSKCPTCRQTRKFKLLKKYKSVDEIEKARFVRSNVKAKIAGRGDEFIEALENDELTDTEDEFLTGVQTDSVSKSFTDTIKEELRENSSKESIINSMVDEGYEKERVEKYIRRKKQNGEIIELNGELRVL